MVFSKNAVVRLGFDGCNLFADLAGEIDHHSVREVREKIDAQLYRCRPRTLIVNLEQVSFMDSSGLGLICGRLRLAQELKTTVKLVNAGVRVMKIFALAGLERMPNLKIEGGTSV